MDDIIRAARELNDSIKSSVACENYRVAREKIEHDSEILEKIKFFKKTQLEYGRADALSFDNEKHLSKLYFDICLSDDAKNFLEAEKLLFKLILSVNNTVWSGCDLDVNFDFF